MTNGESFQYGNYQATITVIDKVVEVEIYHIDGEVALGIWEYKRNKRYPEREKVISDIIKFINKRKEANEEYT